MRNQRKFKWEYVLFILLLGLFVFTRVYRILDLPKGIHIDEAGMAYDAWCLSQFGYDRHFESWPLYLRNFGGGQSSLYAFMTAGLFRLFGYHLFLVRLPGILFSGLTVLFGTLIVRHLKPGEKWLQYFTALLLIICPYFILASRFGLDCNLFLGACTVFLYCLIKAQDSGQYRYYVLAGIAGGITLYTYVISYMVLPVFLVLSFIYALITHKFSFKKWLAMAVPMALLAAPLVAIQMINMFDLPQMKLGVFTLTKLEFYRASEIGMPTFANIKNLVCSIFVNDPWPYNSVPGFWLLYGVSVPLFVAGAIRLCVQFFQTICKKGHKAESYLLLWFVVCFAIGALTETNSNKVNAIFFVVIYMVIEGLEWFVSFVKEKKTQFAYVAIGAVLASYMFCFGRFGIYYYGGQYTMDQDPMPYFFTIVTEAVEYLEEHPEKKNAGTYMDEPGIVLGISTLYPPEEMGSMADADWSATYCDNYYYCRDLTARPNYNYIIKHTNEAWMHDLKAMGYEEVSFDDYSLFIYQK